MSAGELRRTLGGALLLAAGAGLWFWNAGGDTRPALAPGTVLAGTTAIPAAVPTGLTVTPAPASALAPPPRAASEPRAVAATQPHASAPRPQHASAPQPQHPSAPPQQHASVTQPRHPNAPPQRSAAPARLAHAAPAGKPGPRAASGPQIAIGRGYVQSAMRDQALRSARGLLAADGGFDPGQTAMNATLVGRDTVRVSAWKRSDPAAPPQVLVMKRTPTGYALVDRSGGPTPAPTAAPVVVITPTPEPAVRRGLFHRRRAAPPAEAPAAADATESPAASPER